MHAYSGTAEHSGNHSKEPSNHGTRVSGGNMCAPTALPHEHAPPTLTYWLDTSTSHTV